MTSLVLYSPSGVLSAPSSLTLAAKRLRAMGFDVSTDASARSRHQRFAGDDTTRLAALHRIAADSPDIALATRGGYGLTRLLPRIDWRLLVRSIERGTHWVGHSDLTALHMGVMAHAGGRFPVTWAGPLACEDFGRSDDDGGVDEVTRDCFVEAMQGILEAVGFNAGAEFNGLDTSGILWGGNLSLITSLLATQYLPKVEGGILFLEDVHEQPYRIERMLLQLWQAGVLDAQRAIVLGDFTGWKRASLDRGYSLRTVVQHLRALVKPPILTGLAFGHGKRKVTLQVGAPTCLSVDRGTALLSW